MKILHILNDGPDNGQYPLAGSVIRIQSQSNEVTVIDLSAREHSYSDIVDAIFSHDRVISWHGEESAL